MTSISSRPIAPPSPACGLSPETASRGRGDAEIADQRCVHDPRRLDDQRGRQLARDLDQRDVDGHRHDAQPGRDQHHHGARHAAKMREIFGVAGKGEAGALLQQALGDGIGDHSGRPARRAPDARPDRSPRGLRLRSPARPRQGGTARAGPVARPAARGRRRRAPRRARRSRRPPPSAAMPRSRSGSSMRKKGGNPARCCHAATAISPPMPAGSPIVRASGCVTAPGSARRAAFPAAGPRRAARCAG